MHASIKTSGLKAAAILAGIAFATPSYAFYLELPKILQELAGKRGPLSAQVMGQFAPPVGESGGAPGGGPIPGTPMPPIGGTDFQPPSGSFGSGSGSQPGPGAMFQPGPQGSYVPPMPGPDSSNPGQFVPSQGGVMPSGGGTPRGPMPPNVQPGPGAMFQPGPSGGENKISGPDNWQPQNNMSGGQGPSVQGGYGGGDNSQGQQDNARYIQDMKRGASQMEMNLKQFDKMISQAVKKGIAVPKEIEDKLAKAKQDIAALKSAQSESDLENVDMDALQENMQALEESRREVFEAAERLQQTKTGVRQMERGIKTFESQIVKLQKQKIQIPADLADNLSKAKGIIEAVKKATTWSEVEAAGIEDMSDIMGELQDSRQQLDMLTRWPQTLKEINRQVKDLERALKQAKTTAAKLQKNGIDASVSMSALESAVAKLKSVRDSATEKAKSGDIQGAFELLEADFFGQTDDVWEHQRTIQTLANLGGFQAEFKQGLTKLNNEIKRLKRLKEDTTELESVVTKIKTQGDEVTALLKVKPLDQDRVMEDMQVLWDLKQEADKIMMELTGKRESRPWEEGQSQFQAPQLPTNWNQVMPMKPQPQPTASSATSVSVPVPPASQ
ncbi:MAG: hypothetical protein HY978_00300 [Candidatus Liptonbacteria bacterium]|nr:hypothetical protein [Candidatus Liptonbacteria bacterium]